MRRQPGSDTLLDPLLLRRPYARRRKFLGVIHAISIVHPLVHVIEGRLKIQWRKDPCRGRAKLSLLHLHAKVMGVLFTT